MEHSKFKLNYLLPPIIGLAGIACMFIIPELLSGGFLPSLTLLPYERLNTVFSIQIFVLPVSGLILAVMYLYDRRNFIEFFRIGNIGAKAAPIKWLGIRPEASWERIGLYIAIILTSGTLIFMTIGVAVQKAFSLSGTYIRLWPLSLLFSLTNAWSEEIFTLFTVVMGLYGKFKPGIICWISAAIFGIPHYFGMPGGPVGVLMAGFLGWVLAKSVYETKGIFWAWVIHFVQDVVIFSAMLMILVAIG